MEVGEAHGLLVGAHADYARFYGPVGDLALGVGLVLREVAYPFYDDAEREFSVALGRIYLMSHECDLDQANDRPLNTHALICPIIPLEHLLEHYLAARTDEQARAFIDALSKRTVDRATYIPAVPDELPYGGILYFSAMSHTHISELNRPEVIKCCTVSSFGLRYIDAAFTQATLKPKVQPLPLAGSLSRWLTGN